MKRKLIIAGCICVLALTGCGKADTTPNTKTDKVIEEDSNQKELDVYKKSIEDYNARQIKQITEYDIINGAEKIENRITTVDKDASRAMIQYQDNPSMTIYYALEDDIWYSYGKDSTGSWNRTEKPEAETLIKPLELADIAVTDDSAYKIEKEETLNNVKAVKVKITTPRKENPADILKAEYDQVAEFLNSSKEFKKAYEAVEAKKELVSHVWFDADTKELIKMETDITQERVLLHHYLTLTNNSPLYDEIPDTVIQAVEYDGNDTNNTPKEIELPKE